jgi:hypothetical protein
MALDPSARPISRRAAVTALAGLPAVAAVSTLSITLGACQGADNAAGRAAVTVSEAQSALPAGLDPAIVRSIGMGWMAAHPAERTAAALSQAIRAAQRRHRRWPWQPLPPLAAVLTAEYAAGTTVLPDGWVVAETEARCCALVALA